MSDGRSDIAGSEFLAEERTKTNFPVNDLFYHLHGGKESAEALLSSMELLERDPMFNNRNFYDWDSEEIRKITFQQVTRVHALLGKDITSEDAKRRLLPPLGLINPSAQTRLLVHLSLFFGTVSGQGTPDQVDYWVNNGTLSLRDFYGCFAMTELGHGSNVAGVETTATMDLNTDEFVVNTPTLSATKWWIGGAAHSATHTSCYARLIVRGKDYGVHVFVVPLRDTETFELLPGVAVGDIGKKMGRDGIDNGWIQFTNVRIPRTNMLMKYSQVDADGKVSLPPLPQLSYGALVGGRVTIVEDSWWWSERFLTIAIRYAAVRQQFSNSHKGQETRLLDYEYHQRRLMPLLVQTLALQASTEELTSIYSATKAPKDLNDKRALESYLQASKELFALSAGLKALSTWSTAATIDECRQACGGHGYSGYAGFGQGYDDWAVSCTWEGDNNILSLSTGRAVIQSGLRVLAGEKAFGAASYLNESSKKEGSFLDISYLVTLWHWVTRAQVLETASRYKELAKSIGGPAAMEKLSFSRINIARLHCTGFQIASLASSAQHAKPEIQGVLTDSALLFALWSIEKDASVFLKSGALNPETVKEVSNLVDEYCRKVRTYAIGITDSFGLSDFYVNSPLGAHDGQVYTNYWRKVNDANPSMTAKAPYYENVQKPFFKRP